PALAEVFRTFRVDCLGAITDARRWSASELVTDAARLLAVTFHRHGNGRAAAVREGCRHATRSVARRWQADAEGKAERSKYGGAVRSQHVQAEGARDRGRTFTARQAHPRTPRKWYGNSARTARRPAAGSVDRYRRDRRVGRQAGRF